MAQREHLDARITSDLKQRVKDEANARGQSLTVFTERALEAALSDNAKSGSASPTASPQSDIRSKR